MRKVAVLGVAVVLVVALRWWDHHRIQEAPISAYQQSLVASVDIPRLRCRGDDFAVGGVIGPAAASSEQARDLFVNRHIDYPRSNYVTLGATEIAVVYAHTRVDGRTDTTLTVRSTGQDWFVSALQWCGNPA